MAASGDTLAHELYNGVVRAKEVYRAEAHRLGLENAELRAKLREAEESNGWAEDKLNKALEASEAMRAERDAALVLVEKAAWRSMDTAPKDGTEINGYRPDQGVFTFRWAEMSEFVDDDAVVDGHNSEFAWWWHDRWGWMEKELTPTLWKPLPEEPSSALPSTERTRP